MSEEQDYETLLQVAASVLRMALNVAPCTGPEEKVLNAIAAVEMASLDYEEERKGE